MRLTSAFGLSGTGIPMCLLAVVAFLLLIQKGGEVRRKILRGEEVKIEKKGEKKMG